MKLLSIVLPTRDRPRFLRGALESLSNQTLDNFDVCVSDNSSDDSSQKVCEEFENRLDLRYRQTSRPLSMVENWNLALSYARGQFVAVMIDKTAWNSSTVETILRVSQRFPNADVVSWAHDYLIPSDEKEETGYLIPHLLPRMLPHEVSLFEAFMERREFRFPRSLQDGHGYTLGKICFGAYRVDLISRIIERHGTLFHPISPDYASLALASLQSECAIQIGAPLQISRISRTSNGTQSASNPASALTYLKSVDPNLATLPKLPVPGLYQSVENTVGFDLTQFDSNYLLAAPNLLNIRKRVIAEVRDADQDLRLEFVPSEMIEELKREIGRRRVDPQYLLQNFVRLRRELFNRRFVRGIVSVLPRFRVAECQSIHEALQVQDAANSEWSLRLDTSL